MLKIGAFGALALVSIVAPAVAQQPLAQLTLEDALRLATRENPTLRAKELEYRAVQANETTAGLRPNPTASYAAEQLGGAHTEPQHTIAVGQPIELGGKRGRRIDTARAASRVTAAELADVRRQIALQVRKAFNDALVAQATRELTQDNLRTLDEVERLQRLRADKGEISGLELTRIELQRFASERDLADAGQAMATARIALRSAVGAEAVAEDFTVEGRLEFRQVALDRHALYRRTLDNRPDLRASEAARARARAEHDLARANAWWDVTPQLQYQRIGSDNTVGVGLSVPLRIFDRNQGEIARTRAEIERAAALRQAAVVQALAEVDTAFSQVTIEGGKVVRLRDTYLPKARQARETVEYAYRRGGVGLLDFLDAQRTYRETALDHIRALGNYVNALSQLEAAVGGQLED